MAGLVGGLFNSILGGSKEDYGRNMVVYKGTIVVMKKILMLDLMDRAADLQDDASELLGKHISVQLVGNEVDPSKHFLKDQFQCTLSSSARFSP